MFNIFKKRANGSQAANQSPVAPENRLQISDNTDFEKLFAEIEHPNHQEPEVPKVQPKPSGTSDNRLSITYNPTPAAGVRYPDMGPFEKREIFRHDARKMIYHRGRRYAMAYVTSETARKLQIEFLISEYSGVMDTLIKGLKHEISKKEAVYNTGNELVKEQLKPTIDDMTAELTNMEEQLYQAQEHEGEVTHAIKAFNRGWDLGVMKILRNIDLKDKALDEIDSQEDGGEL